MRGFLTVLLLSGGLAVGVIATTALAEEPPPCGCGGPKAFFAEKYGTVVPPTAPGAPAPAAEATTEGSAATPSSAEPSGATVGEAPALTPSN